MYTVERAGDCPHRDILLPRRDSLRGDGRQARYRARRQTMPAQENELCTVAHESNQGREIESTESSPWGADGCWPSAVTLLIAFATQAVLLFAHGRYRCYTLRSESIGLNRTHTQACYMKQA